MDTPSANRSFILANRSGQIMNKIKSFKTTIFKPKKTKLPRNHLSPLTANRSFRSLWVWIKTRLNDFFVQQGLIGNFRISSISIGEMAPWFSRSRPSLSLPSQPLSSARLPGESTSLSIQVSVNRMRSASMAQRQNCQIGLVPTCPTR